MGVPSVAARVTTGPMRDRPSRCRSAWCSLRPRSARTWARCARTAQGSKRSGSRTSSRTTTCSAPTPRCTTPLGRPLRRRHDVPRAVRAVRLPRRHHEARAGHRRDHPPATADRACGEAGGRGRHLVRRPLPTRHRRRLERGGVRRSRPELRRSRCAQRRADRPPATAVHRALGDVRGSLRARDRSGHRSPSGPAPDPDLVRRVDAPCVPSCRPPRRRMVPDGAARPTPRGGAGDRRRGSTRGGPRPLVDRDGRQGELDTPRAVSHRSSITSSDGGAQVRLTSRSTRCAPASCRSTITSPRSRRSRTRLELARPR